MSRSIASVRSGFSVFPRSLFPQPLALLAALAAGTASAADRSAILDPRLALRRGRSRGRSRRISATAVTSLAIGGAIIGPVATASAGIYSPGKGGPAEAAFVDAGIPGFVGPAGLGVAPTANNGNYVNPVFAGWATGYANYLPSDNVGTYGQNGIGSQFANPALATGPVTGNNMDIVSFGDLDAAEITAGKAPGMLTLTFDKGIRNGPGADFAAFENGFVSNYNTGAGSAAGQMFAELGFVEVSTDGTNFARFPSRYLNYPNGSGVPANTAYLTQDVSNIYNLVGKHANAYSASWGTPFNLDDLADHPLVLDETIDLNNIQFVRIVDIAGNGTFKDSLGNGIYDAWVTWGSGGLDFEALGVINQVPEPSLIGVVLGAGAMLMRRRRV